MLRKNNARLSLVILFDTLRQRGFHKRKLRDVLQGYKGPSRGAPESKITDNAESSRQTFGDMTSLTQKEIEQMQHLLRMLPSKSDKNVVSSRSEDELDTDFNERT